MTRPLKLTDPLMSGEDVFEAQKALGEAGYSIVADGVYGKVTESVVKQFQKNHKLAETGEFGQAEREALNLT